MLTTVHSRASVRRPIKPAEYRAQYGNAEWQPGQVLGKLGPDLDPEELQAKRERQERVKAYADAVRLENKQVSLSL